MDRVADLYRDHLKFVWRVLWRARMPAADIKDVAHDVFLVVLLKMRAKDPQLKSQDKERAWLYRITIYELKNYRARARFRGTEPMDDHFKDIPDARNDAARLADREQLLLLLDSITGQGRAVFELVELEGFSVVEAARTLEITETNAHKRLGLARQEVEAAVAKLAERDEAAGKTKTSAFLMPFGVGAWLQLRDLQAPPEGVADQIWERLQATAAAIDGEHNKPAAPSPPKSPAQSRAGRLLEKLTGPVKAHLGNLVSGCFGGGIVALLFLLRPNATIATLRIPVPFVLGTSSTSAPARLPAPSSPDGISPDDATLSADTVPSAEVVLDEETQLIRQARAAYATGNRTKTIDAISAYERLFPAGRFRHVTRELRATLPAARGK
jgi:RNA polymerase sigma-70 factor (ECF subfamily)